MTLKKYFEKPTAEEKKYMDKRLKSQPSKAECLKNERKKILRREMSNNRSIGSHK